MYLVFPLSAPGYWLCFCHVNNNTVYYDMCCCSSGVVFKPKLKNWEGPDVFIVITTSDLLNVGFGKACTFFFLRTVFLARHPHCRNVSFDTTNIPGTWENKSRG